MKKQREYTEDGDGQSKKVLKSIKGGLSPEASRYKHSDEFKQDKKSGNEEYKKRKKAEKKQARKAGTGNHPMSK
jgi:hypothetical protein